MALRLVFIGPPGSGKGTQAKLLKARGFAHLSSGDLLRAEIAAGTPRGRSIAGVVQSGGLVADATLFEIVDDFLRRNPELPVLFDGYPRTLAQARQLAKIGIDAAVFFQIPDEVILRRLGDRVIGPDGTIYDLKLYPPPHGLAVTRREDDDPEIQRRRLVLYREREAPLRDFYKSAALYHEIDASQLVPAVEAQVNRLIKQLTTAKPVGV